MFQTVTAFFAAAPAFPHAGKPIFVTLPFQRLSGKTFGCKFKSASGTPNKRRKYGRYFQTTS
ncbi:MAG: hypothetical protein M3209_11825 [Acidobacteriota bacterium]|nr:hypothetical protein [Acidobacteriota bacterium]